MTLLKIYLRIKNLFSHVELDKVSRDLFDGFYQIGNFSVILNPDDRRKFREYSGHIIKFPNFLPPFEMEIYTGEDELTPEQRQKYFRFVNSVFEKYKQNSGK